MFQNDMLLIKYDQNFFDFRTSQNKPNEKKGVGVGLYRINNKTFTTYYTHNYNTVYSP